MRKSRFIKISSRSIAMSAACSAALMVCRSAHAADYSWITPGGDNWNTAANWNTSAGSGIAFPVAGDTATFNDAGNDSVAEIISLNGNETASTVTVSNASSTNFSTGMSFGTPVNGQTLTLTGGINVLNGAGSVSFGSSVTNNNVIIVADGNISLINNSTNTMSVSSANNTSNIAFEGGAPGVNTVTFDGTGNFLSIGTFKDNNGTIAIVKNGPGTLELDGALASASISGGITLNAGTMNLKSSNVFGNSTKTTFTINGGDVASIGSARSIPASVSVIVDGDCTMGTSTVGGQATVFLGSVNLGGAVRNIVCNNSVTFSNLISNGGLTKALSGTNNTTITLGSSNTYTGPTTILSGTLLAATSNVVTDSSTVTLAAGTTFNTGGFSQSVNSISDSGAGATILLGNLTEGTLTTGNDNTSTTFIGQIAGNGNNTPGGLNKAGAGTFTVGSNNIYNGVTTISGGVLSISKLANSALSPTISATAGSKTAAVSDPTGLQVGMTVDNLNNIPVGTTISAISGNSITLSATATANTTSTATVIGFSNSLGLTTPDASRLVLNGGTLRYTGSSVSTDRLFTVTQNGGTIDASGASNAALTFAGNTVSGANAVAFNGTGDRMLTLTGSSTGSNVLAPALSDSSQGGVTSLAKTGPGKWVLTSASIISGSLSPSGGTLEIDGNFNAGSLAGNATGTLNVVGANVAIAPHAADADSAGNLAAVSVTSGGQLDLANNDLIVNYATSSPATAIQAMLKSGYNNGNWKGPGLASSTAASTAGTALGYADAADVGITTFDGQSLAGNAVLVKYTYAGDSSLDGKVDLGNDFNLFLQGFLNHGSTWELGDYNYDGTVDVNDFKMFVAGFAAGGSPLGELDEVISGSSLLSVAQKAELLSVVPEPASLAMLTCGACAFGTRRRRRA